MRLAPALAELQAQYTVGQKKDSERREKNRKEKNVSVGEELPLLELCTYLKGPDIYRIFIWGEESERRHRIAIW